MRRLLQFLSNMDAQAWRALAVSFLLLLLINGLQWWSTRRLEVL